MNVVYAVSYYSHSLIVITFFPDYSAKNTDFLFLLFGYFTPAK